MYRKPVLSELGKASELTQGYFMIGPRELFGTYFDSWF